MQKTGLIDLELTKNVKNGSSLAFELLYKLYFRPLCNYALVFVKNIEISAEIVQETFIKIWENRELLDENQAVKPYLFRSVHNNCINFIKKAKVQNQLTQEYILHVQNRLHILEADNSNGFFEKLACEELEYSINNTIEALPDQCREVFILSRFNELSYKEIADKLNISVNTVKTQLSRALQKIREGIKDLKE